ncbi:MAG: hypothetical protein ACKO6N_27625 [Myxococcota bacterium]
MIFNGDGRDIFWTVAHEVGSGPPVMGRVLDAGGRAAAPALLEKGFSPG